jgi:hypothetical protein
MTFAIKGTHEATILYCGDEWTTAKDLYESTSVDFLPMKLCHAIVLRSTSDSFMIRYVWLPATVDDKIGSYTIDWHDLYAIVVKTGRVTYPEGQTYEAEDGVVVGSAYKTICVSEFEVSQLTEHNSSGLFVQSSQHALGMES